jgi:Mrp family chromosome partitioning ATPase
LKLRSDWVVIDSPPLLAVADAAAIARWVDGVLIVTRGGTSTRDAATKGREMLEKVGARICGVAVWGLEEGASARGYGYDGYGGHYSEYYNHGSEQRRAEREPDRGGAAQRAARTIVRILRSRTQAEPDASRPKANIGQRVAEGVGRLMAGVVALVVVVLVALVVYLLDRYLG